MANNADHKKDYYSILGAEESDEAGVIERSYKRLAVRHHPDRGGDEEEMKLINEAYRVLGDEDSRQAYDATRSNGRRSSRANEYTPRRSPSAQADVFSGRVVGALLCLLSGLGLLLLVRFQFIWFLWPLAMLALFVIVAGVWMAHATMAFARDSFAPQHPARRFVWAQETVFWGAVLACGYGLYLVMSAV
ncbi:MAG TPA: DnaJ domain-containing protein [Pyrinomonadaceae bacterium]|nr:DnaJ domain-containing protein [Pyrinomonadaceae bacterium]